MTGEEAVSFYHSLLRFGIRPGLERIIELCRILGDPQKRLRFIHVAGTNGKGSVCTELAGILHAAGYHVGLYTSPYVIDFRERICFDGEMIPADALGEVTEEVKRAVDLLDREGIVITEFEAITAAAFVWYAKINCDVVVLETGLGGRFDATNVIDPPLACVITSVSLDHMAILGDSTEKIAAEKAGIIKEGCEVITSASQEVAVLAVLQKKCVEVSAHLHVADAGRLFSVDAADIFGTTVRCNGTEIKIPFPGTHQVENSALVLKTVDCLRKKGLVIEFSAVKSGIEHAFIPARTEILCRKPLIILDGCHNDGSTQALASFLRTNLAEKKILAVTGMMADKDHNAVFSHLLPLFSYVVCVTPSNPRAISAGELSEMIHAYGVLSSSFDDPIRGIDYSLGKLESFDALVVCGSLYLAGDVRDHLIRKIEILY